MSAIKFQAVRVVTVSLICCLATVHTLAADPTPEAALRLRPIQSDVDCDTPSGDAMKDCVVKASNEPGASGWFVYNSGGQLLRRFLDTNGDNRLDQWCYYKGGIEIYRDIDANYNGKADQYRWLGTAGIRWGLDKDEDGRIDVWKKISAEEITSEVVAALMDKDRTRFLRLLPTTTELQALGLGKVQLADLTKKVAAATKAFEDLAARQTAVTATTRWLHFGASPPGMLAAGFEGSTRDVMVYDNVSAIIETDGRANQVSIGTLISVEGGWRLIDLPGLSGDDRTADGGYFFQQLAPNQPQVAVADEGISKETQKLILDLEKVDKAIEQAATPAALAQLNQQRATIIEQLAKSTDDPKERETWLRQYADTVSAAAQSGNFPAGVAKLKVLATGLAGSPSAKGLLAYVTYRALAAEYGASLTKADDDDYAKIQEKREADLEDFVERFPQAEDAAEAILELAVGDEFAGKTEEAVQWYGQIITRFPTSQQAKKANGARRRLQSVGNPISLAGTTLDGKSLTLDSYRGKTVLIHYWATWCEPCKQDLTVLKQMQAKYARQGFTLIGVNLDSDAATANRFLQSTPLSWPQLYEAGGLDSRLAVELGILTLPTMLLLNSEGKVANRNIHAGELDQELGKLLR